MSQRMFKPTDPDWPTTKTMQDHLRAKGLVDEPTRQKPAVVLVGRAAAGQAPGSAAPDEPHFVLGTGERGVPVFLRLQRLLAGRMLVQGSSGAGKSTMLRRMVEESHQFLTTIIVDPEGEFGNLAEHIGAVSLSAAAVASDGLTQAALGARKHRIPLHVDLSDLEPDRRIQKAAAFFAGLMSSPREDWENTALVVIDEAHLLAPHVAGSARDAETRRLGVATLTELCSMGRKRGIAAVVSTQRLAKLATSVVSELHNIALGLNVFDRDIRRAADLLGWTYDKTSTMRDLTPGEFMVLGPAMCSLPTLCRVGGTVTRHVGKTPELLPSAGHGRAGGAELLRVDQLIEHVAASRMPAGRGGRLLDAFLLEPAGPDAVRIIAALTKISPNATPCADLALHLGVDQAAVSAALDLLSGIGAVDMTPRGAGRIARLSPRLRVRLTDTRVVGLR